MTKAVLYGASRWLLCLLISLAMMTLPGCFTAMLWNGGWMTVADSQPEVRCDGDAEETSADGGMGEEPDAVEHSGASTWRKVALTPVTLVLDVAVVPIAVVVGGVGVIVGGVCEAFSAMVSADDASASHRR